MRGLILGLLLVAADAQAQEVTATDTGGLVIVIPPELLQLPQPTPEPPPPKSKSGLAMPTTFYVTTAAVEWTTSTPPCESTCGTRVATLPGAEEPKLTVPLGLAIDAAVIWLCHSVIESRWPKVAEGILYGVSILRAMNAADHIQTQRRRNRGLPN